MRRISWYSVATDGKQWCVGWECGLGGRDQGEGGREETKTVSICVGREGWNQSWAGGMEKRG